MAKVLTLFGTRPEIIKLAPVIRQLESAGRRLAAVNVSSGQHRELLRPFVDLFGIRVDHDLAAMRPGQGLSALCARVMSAADGVIEAERPDLVLVQGDTTTALAGAMAAFHRRVAVAHVEAGLRTGDVADPYPEELNRILISRIAAYHFAPTEQNRANLLREGVPDARVFVTGNTVVDALKAMLKEGGVSPRVGGLLAATRGSRRVLLTTHRRESFGPVLEANLAAVRRFVEAHPDATLLFPVHANPAVQAAARQILSGHPRVHLLEPLDYRDFIVLMSRAWLIASDSGGVQEEAASLGVPLLVLRRATERPEALACGAARLVPDPESLAAGLEQAWAGPSQPGGPGLNPFGRGDSARRIARILRQLPELRGGPPDERG